MANEKFHETMANAFWRLLTLISAGIGFLVYNETSVDSVSFEFTALSVFWVICLIFGLAFTLRLKE